MNDTPANMGWITPSIRVLPTAEKTRYLVFFKARDRAAIDQAMRAYAMDFLAKRKAQRNVQPQLDTASPSKQKERSRQKGRER